MNCHGCNNYIVYQIVYILVQYVAITSPSFITLHLLVSEIVKCIAWGFYKNYIVYYNVYCYYSGVSVCQVSS